MSDGNYHLCYGIEGQVKFYRICIYASIFTSTATYATKEGH